MLFSVNIETNDTSDPHGPCVGKVYVGVTLCVSPHCHEK